METKQAARPSFFQKLGRGRKRGIALFEVILALGLVAAVITGAVLLIQAGQDRQRLNDTNSAINQLRASVQTMLAGQSNCTPLAMNALYGRKGVPENLVTTIPTGNPLAGGVYEHPYGAAIGIDGFTARRYHIWLDNLDNDTCADILAPYVGKTRSGAGLISVTVGATPTGGTAPTQQTTAPSPVATGAAATTEGRGIWGNTAGTVLPLVAADLEAMCDSGQNANRIVLQFGG